MYSQNKSQVTLRCLVIFLSRACPLVGAGKSFKSVRDPARSLTPRPRTLVLLGLGPGLALALHITYIGYNYNYD